MKKLFLIKFLLVLICFSASLVAMSSPVTCVICQEPIAVGQQVCGDRLFGCDARHVCHIECMKKWVQTCRESGMPSCPVCRALMQLPLPADIPNCVRAVMYSQPHAYEELLDAVEHNDAVRIHQLVDDGIDIHQQHERGLQVAVIEHKWDAMRVLIELGANVHVGGDNALRTVANRQKFTLIPFLVEHGADINVSDGMPLRAAVRGNKIDSIEFLLVHGADANVAKSLPHGGQETPIGLAIEKNNLAVVRLLVEHGAQIPDILINSTLPSEHPDIADFFLAYRVQCGDPVDLDAFVHHMDFYSGIRWCVERGARDQQALQRALCSAVKYFNIENAQWFLAHGADINVDNGAALIAVIDAAYDFQWDERNELSEIKRSLKPYSLDMIRFLFEHGMSQANKERALQYASEKDFHEIVHEFIRLGVSPNAGGGCLVSQAIKRRNINELMKLVEKGADVRDDRFMQLAEASQNETIIQFLRIVRR